ncbi:MAG: HEAT repeat domain-containing protein [Clostridium sp.]|nr:HEAT repeat domain-containing protein [Clostridium sp.]
MFSSNIKSFIFFNIYFLIVVDIFLLLGIYFEIIKNKVRTKHYEKAYEKLKSKILDYIKNEDKILEIQQLLNKDFNKNVAIDIMVNYSQENDVDISEKFIKLNLDRFIIDKIREKAKIDYIKKLSFMRVETAYDTLLKLSSSEDLDISYISFFGLSMINNEKWKKEIVIKKLIYSNILSDRIIEILNRFQLSFEHWLELLEKEESTNGKVIFIKTITPKEEMKKVENSDRLLKFLDDQVEVKISTILALCNSKNDKYVDKLKDIYESEENWQVRVIIAKGFRNFKFDKVKDVLLKMTKDKEWWVRYNALKSIVAMGEEGVFTLIDLSLEKEDKNISDLAYYFLNSNREVYNIVKNIEV